MTARPSSEATARASFGGLAIQVWLFAFVAFAGTTLLAPHPLLRLAGVILYAVPVLAWAVVRGRGPSDLLEVAILVGVAAHLVVSAASLDRPSSLEASGAVAAYAAAFLLARRIGHDPALMRLAATAMVTALAFWVAVVAVTWVAEKGSDLQILGWPPRLAAHQAYVWGSINSPPLLALLAAPFVAWLPPGRFRSSMAVILAAGAAVIVPFSIGRAAWLGIAASLVAFEALTGFPNVQRLRRAGLAGRVLLGAGAAAAVGALAFAVGRLDAVALAFDSRLRLWDQALGLFAADPLTGSGPSTFAWARLAHVPDYVDRVAAGAAHNLAFQTLADGGIVMAAALGFLIVAYGARVAADVDRLSTPQRLAVAALIGYGAFGLLDDLSFIPSVTVVLIVLAAWAIPVSDARIGPATGAWQYIAPVVIGAAAVVALPAAQAMTAARLATAEAREAALAADWSEARDGFARAAELQPANALHWLSLGLAEHHLGDVRAAAEAYEAARAANPGDPRAWGALAALAPPSGRPRLLEEAARRSNDPQYAYRLGTLELELGNHDAAVRALAISAIDEPDLVSTLPESVRASLGEALGPAAARVGTLAEEPPEIASWNLALLNDRRDRTAPSQWEVARAIDAGASEAASDALARALVVDAHSARTHQAAAAVAHLACDRAEFSRAQARIDHLGEEPRRIGQPPAERRSGIYGMPDLGDYQPIDHDDLPLLPGWPTGLIELPDCGW